MRKHSQKSTCLLALMVVPLAASSASAGTAQSVYGRWLTDDRSGIVEIAPCGSATCGTLVRVLDPAAPDRDINNPDPARRGRSLVGTRVLAGLRQAGKAWKGGQAYDPKAGRSYKASIALGSAARLDVTGCLLFVCRTRHWQRVGGDTSQ